MKNGTEKEFTLWKPLVFPLKPTLIMLVVFAALIAAQAVIWSKYFDFRSVVDLSGINYQKAGMFLDFVFPMIIIALVARNRIKLFVYRIL